MPTGDRVSEYAQAASMNSRCPSNESRDQRPAAIALVLHAGDCDFVLRFCMGRKEQSHRKVAQELFPSHIIMSK